jgi:hypothetical protein
MKKLIGLLGAAGLLIPSAAMAGSLTNNYGASAERVTGAGFSDTNVTVRSDIHKNNTMHVLGANWGGSISADAENLSWGSRTMNYDYDRVSGQGAASQEFDNNYKSKSEFASEGDFGVEHESDSAYHNYGDSHENGGYHDRSRDTSHTEYGEIVTGDETSNTLGGSLEGGGGSTHETSTTTTTPAETCGRGSGRHCQESPEVAHTETTTSGGGGGGEIYGERTHTDSAEVTNGDVDTVNRGRANGTDYRDSNYSDEGSSHAFSGIDGGYEVEGEAKAEGQGGVGTDATIDGATASSYGHGSEHFFDGAGTINRDYYANGYAGSLHENGDTHTVVKMDTKNVFTSRGFETSSFSGTSWD